MPRALVIWCGTLSRMQQTQRPSDLVDWFFVDFDKLLDARKDWCFEE
jgi:hypothetical protein